MTITEITAMVLRLPEVTSACDGTQDTCLIKIDTDEGITGWGEVDSCPSVVKAIVDAPLSHQICNGLRNALLWVPTPWRLMPVRSSWKKPPITMVGPQPAPSPRQV